jgi:hypothetical protein
MNAVLEQERIEHYDATRYNAGRQLTEDLIDEHNLASIDGLVSYLGRCIATEDGATLERAVEVGEAVAALFIAVREESGSTAQAMIAAATLARLIDAKTAVYPKV